MTSNWWQLLASNWCCTLTFFLMQLTFFWTELFFSFFFASGHWHHMIFAIWYQQDVNIRSNEIVPWYWPIVYINLRFECCYWCDLGCRVALVWTGVDILLQFMHTEDHRDIESDWTASCFFTSGHHWDIKGVTVSSCNWVSSDRLSRISFVTNYCKHFNTNVYDILHCQLILFRLWVSMENIHLHFVSDYLCFKYLWYSTLLVDAL